MANKDNLREGSAFGPSLLPEYDYVLQYIEDGVEAREPIVRHTERAIKAYYGEPSADRYIGRIKDLAGQFAGDDSDRAKALEDACKNITPRKNFTIMRAVDTLVAQASGGISQYESEVFDPYFKKDREIVDKINEAARYVYMDNHVDSMLPQGIEFATLSGEVYTLIEKKKGSDKELDLTWIPSTEMLLDPVRMKRNRERFIGHQTTMSWSELKRFIKTDKNEVPYLEAINSVDTYLIQIEGLVSKYSNWDAFSRSVGDSLRHDVDLYYTSSIMNYYDKVANGYKDKYIADDVEVSYIYVLDEKKRYTVVNRRFIVRIESDYLSTELGYTYPTVNAYTGQVEDKDGSVKVSLDHPYVPLTNKRSLWANYSYTKLIPLLDMFDDICALETLIHHTISIMTPITFTGNPTDVEKLAGIAGVSGEIIKGFIANSVTVLNKAIDLTPALSQIQRLESTIKWILNGPDAKEQAEMMGDRASGTEASLASSTVTQNLAPFMSNIEAWASNLANKMFKSLVIYNGKDWEYQFPMQYSIASLSKEDLAGDIKFRAILRNRIKVEQRQQAQMTMQWFVPMVQSEVIKNKEKMVQDIIPTLAEGFSRRQIQSWFEEDEFSKQMKELQIRQANATVEAQEKANDSIDLSYVNPEGSEGQFGQVDISRALSGDSYEQELDMSMERPQANKPYPTSRSLQYGLTPHMEGKNIPIPSLLPGEAAGEYIPPEMMSSDVEEMLGGALAGGTAGSFKISNSTESGGIAANEPLVGKNSVEGGHVNQ